MRGCLFGMLSLPRSLHKAKKVNQGSERCGNQTQRELPQKWTRDNVVELMSDWDTPEAEDFQRIADIHNAIIEVLTAEWRFQQEAERKKLIARIAELEARRARR